MPNRYSIFAGVAVGVLKERRIGPGRKSVAAFWKSRSILDSGQEYHEVR